MIKARANRKKKKNRMFPDNRELQLKKEKDLVCRNQVQREFQDKILEVLGRDRSPKRKICNMLLFVSRTQKTKCSSWEKTLLKSKTNLSTLAVIIHQGLNFLNGNLFPNKAVPNREKAVCLMMTKTMTCRMNEWVLLSFPAAITQWRTIQRLTVH